MHKPSPSRMSALLAVAQLVGIKEISSTAEVLRKNRGPAPSGVKWITGVYIPGGERCNVEPTRIKNPKVAANVKMMHDNWFRKKFNREPE